MYGEVNCSYEDITQVTGRLKAAVARRVVKATEPLGRGMLKTFVALKLERFFSLFSKVHKTPQHPYTTIITIIMLNWTIKTFGGMPT